MNLINLISENITLPISDIITGQSVSKQLKSLQSSQWWSADEIRIFQETRLKSLIKHSIETVPYYKELFMANNLELRDFTSLSDLKKVPVLTKSKIKNEGQAKFTSNAIPFYKRINSSSSGSTGEPLFYYTTKDAYSIKLACNLRGWYWMGFRLGDKYVKLSQNPRNNFIKRLQDRLSNNSYMSVNPLTNENLDSILSKIEKFKPEFIRCYPDPLLFLARNRKKKSKLNYFPRAINTTGNTLYPEVRSEIEDSFDCKIFDSYSCEGNSTFFECPTHECYHASDEYGITEVLDINGDSISKGIGRLISTDLWNYAHPFIRYDTQDLVEIDNQTCICGRIHFRIKRILGRNNEILEMESGRKFIVHNFTGFFQTDIKELKRSIDQFQIVKTINLVCIKLVVNTNYDDSVRTYIKSHWENELKCKVLIEIVEQIPLTRSGKRRFILNETIIDQNN